MTLKEEVVFYIEAKIKAEKAEQSEEDFRKRVTSLFLEGQISDKAWPILQDVFEWKKEEKKSAITIGAGIIREAPVMKKVEAPTKIVTVSDPCSRGFSYSPRC